MPEEKPEPKISLPEIIIVGLLIGLADLLELVLLFFGLDDFWISDAIAFPATQIYLKIKGVSGTYSLIANTLELIPWVGDLPLRTVGFLVTVWIDRHPSEKLMTVAGVAGIAHQKELPYAKLSAPAGPAARAGAPAAHGIEVGGEELAARGGEMRGLRGGVAGAPVGAAPIGRAARTEGVFAGVPGEVRAGTMAPAARGGGSPFEAGGGAEGAAGRGFSTEELFMEKSPLEKLKESMEQLPEIRKRQNEVAVDDSINQINLKNAA